MLQNCVCGELDANAITMAITQLVKAGGCVAIPVGTVGRGFKSKQSRSEGDKKTLAKKTHFVRT